MFWRICKHVEFNSIYFAKESKKEGFALQSMENNVERKPEGNHKLDKTYYKCPVLDRNMVFIRHNF